MKDNINHTCPCGSGKAYRACCGYKILQYLQQAWQHHSQQRPEEAKALCHKVLQQQPNQPDALHLLGVLAYQAGQLKQALELLCKAIKYNPVAAAYFCNLALIYTAYDQSNEAIRAYQTALKLKPDMAEAHYNKGILHRKQGELDKAVDCFNHTIRIRPDFAPAYNSLGNTLKDQGELEAARNNFQRALQIKPDYAIAYCNLGHTLKALKQPDLALQNYHNALELNPNISEAHSGMGKIFMEQGNPGAAITHFRLATAYDPDSVESLFQVGTALIMQGKPEQAIAIFTSILKLKPYNAIAYVNLGTALINLGRIAEADTSFAKALALAPDLPNAHAGQALSKESQGQIIAAIAYYKKALKLDPEYAEAYIGLGNIHLRGGQPNEAIKYFQKALRYTPNHSIAYSNYLLSLNYCTNRSPQEIFEEHLKFAKHFANPENFTQSPHTNDPVPDRRLRIGYVSPDFHTHSVAYFIEPVLANHDPKQVEVFAYYNHLHNDDVTIRLKGYCQHWRNIIGIEDEQVSEMIRKDKIDILIDLAGHTSQNRLLVFAHKPSPIQVSWLGYLNTSGLAQMDYHLTDRWFNPEGTTENLYTEKLLRLPECAWCFSETILNKYPSVTATPAKRTGYVTFACLNNTAKVTRDVIVLWSKILGTVPEARLILASSQLGDEDVRQRYYQHFSSQGINPERVDMMGKVPLHEYLEIYTRIDIALDPFPFCGGTVSCQALWMGVPVITLAGTLGFWRTGVSILSTIGLSELVAQSKKDYASIAINLANDLDRLGKLRAGLRQRMANSPLMDAPRFTRHLEDAYRKIWIGWCQQQKHS